MADMKPKARGERDWRLPLPLRRCEACGATETSCEANQLFSGRKCCGACEHPNQETP